MIPGKSYKSVKISVKKEMMLNVVIHFFKGIFNQITKAMR